MLHGPPHVGVVWFLSDPTAPAAHLLTQPSKSPDIAPVGDDHCPMRQPQVTGVGAKTVLASPALLPTNVESAMVDIEVKVGRDS